MCAKLSMPKAGGANRGGRGKNCARNKKSKGGTDPPGGAAGSRKKENVDSTDTGGVNGANPEGGGKKFLRTRSSPRITGTQ